MSSEWYDVPSDEMTLEQARQAVKDLRRKLAEHLDQEPCTDAVSRQAVKEILLTITFNKEDLQKLVDEKVAEIKESMCKTGKWIIDDKEHGRIWHCHCSNCKKDPQYYIGGTENWWLVRLPDYCPNCSAKMDKE